MVPFGKAAFFPGQLIHTNEFLVLLGEGYYADRTSKQTAEILKRRGKALVTQAESLKAVTQDLMAEASFFGATASESAEGLVEIREDYEDEGSSEPLLTADNKSFTHFIEEDDTKAEVEDEEYKRIFSRIAELEMEEEEAEKANEYEEDEQIPNVLDNSISPSSIDQAQLLEEPLVPKGKLTPEEPPVSKEVMATTRSEADWDAWERLIIESRENMNKLREDMNAVMANLVKVNKSLSHLSLELKSLGPAKEDRGGVGEGEIGDGERADSELQEPGDEGNDAEEQGEADTHGEEATDTSGTADGVLVGTLLVVIVGWSDGSGAWMGGADGAAIAIGVKVRDWFQWVKSRTPNWNWNRFAEELIHRYSGRKAANPYESYASFKWGELPVDEHIKEELLLSRMSYTTKEGSANYRGETRQGGGDGSMGRAQRTDCDRFGYIQAHEGQIRSNTTSVGPEGGCLRPNALTSPNPTTQSSSGDLDGPPYGSYPSYNSSVVTKGSGVPDVKEKVQAPVTASNTAFTGSIVEHSHNIRTNSTTDLADAPSSKPVSRFKLHRK
ncbi:RNA polymerase II subunit 5-mediating protein [Dorcoceras hygrometricum]|uniref:RNA polymerase II subunit 5-mediating protein n=1 Tax=Dorcoceras hygrometricum TaxID=472368 RepID=A0A2Z7BY59_9LAMI|nr:RNA polymerase II subunit 5-mediating protein [Dorcoceras hygrometricum]